MQMKDALGGSLLLTVQPMSQFLGQFLSPLKQFCIEVMGRGYKEKVRDRQKKKEKKKKGKKEGRRERRKGGKKERKGGRGREREWREKRYCLKHSLCVSPSRMLSQTFPSPGITLSFLWNVAASTRCKTTHISWLLWSFVDLLHRRYLATVWKFPFDLYTMD